MRKELIKLLDSDLSYLFNDVSEWSSLLIEKYPPIIHRLYRRINDDYTVMLHRLFNAEGQPCLMHSHSWPFALKVIEGGYEMGMGFSKERSSSRNYLSDGNKGRRCL